MSPPIRVLDVVEAKIFEHGDRWVVFWVDVGEQGRVRSLLETDDGFGAAAFATIFSKQENSDLVRVGQVHGPDTNAVVDEQPPFLVRVSQNKVDVCDTVRHRNVAYIGARVPLREQIVEKVQRFRGDGGLAWPVYAFQIDHGSFSSRNHVTLSSPVARLHSNP